MSKGPWSDERGNATAGLLVMVGGISLVLAQNEMRSVDAKRQKAKVEMAISQSTFQNNSSLQLAARVLKGSQTGQAAPVHLNPYIIGPVCDQNRQLQATQGNTWQATTDSIVIRNYSNQQLQAENDAIFNRLRAGQSPALTPSDSNTLRVLGYKCSTDPLKPYLVEGVYVEARTQDAQNKTMLAKALLPMDAPPPSVPQPVIPSPPRPQTWRWLLPLPKHSARPHTARTPLLPASRTCCPARPRAP